jgi:hypothetical protein
VSLRSVKRKRWVKQFCLSACLLLAVVGVLGYASSVFADGETIEGETQYAGLINDATAIDNLEIIGSASDTVPVRLFVTHGTLAMNTTTGLTFAGDTVGSLLEFSGTVSDVNAALVTLTYTRSSAGEDTLEMSLVESGEVFFPDNGHLYKYVSNTLDWNAAQTAAAAQSQYGADGYLATITSESENNFVADRLLGAGWMGASDIASEGDWKWVTGPELGTSFWSGAVNGTPVDERYNNWAAEEPNDFDFNEDCGQFLASGSGEWNDLPCSGHTLGGYVVEFGATGDMPQVASHEATIYTVQEPDFDSPISDTASNSIDVDFTLYSTPLSGTLKMGFYGANFRSVTFDDLGVGQHTFSLDPANMLLNSNVTSAYPNGTMPDDTYVTVTLEYTDAVSGYNFRQEIDNFTIDTTGPTITSLSPADGATGVAVDSNLVIEFNEPVQKGSGNIIISEVGSGGTFESIPVGSSAVTGEGTNTITINPSADFEPGIDYFVNNLNGLFTDELGNSESTNPWQFTALAAPEMQCIQPTATQTTIAAGCTSSPAGWGTTTWEARYKKQTDSSYTTINDINIDEDDVANVLLTGLDAETDYDVQFRFTNDFGLSEWGTVEITTLDNPDNDGDGVLDVDEATGPNGGDANNDDIQDSEQGNVISFTNSVSGKAVALIVSEECVFTQHSSLGEQATGTVDEAYDYSEGLLGFTADCSTSGFSANVTHIYFDTTHAGETTRKYNASTQQYADIAGVTITQQNIAGRAVTTVSYVVTDGGANDEDGVVNGSIKDPAGLATAVQSLASTGQPLFMIILVAICLMSIAGGFFWKSARTSKR